MQQVIERYTKDHETQIVERSDGTSWIEGYAVVWGEYQMPNGRWERVDRSAFTKVLAEQTEPVSARFNHSRDYELDRSDLSLTLTSDIHGLRYKFPYDSSDPDHAKVRSKIKKGLIRGSSFKALASYKWQNDGNREIGVVEEIARLDDVGPVDHPANQNTTAIMRSDSDELEASYQEWKTQMGETEKRLARIDKLV
jgi:HK97 family phage prohead protease